MDTIFIFIAEKLFLLSPLIAGWVFYKSEREIQKEMLLFAFFSLPLTFIMASLARELYFNPLPFVLRGFEPLISHAPNNGFPSDHVLLLAAIASIFSFFYRRISAVLWFIALLVGLARVYVGVHHLVDIAGSILIALLAACIVHVIITIHGRSRTVSK